MAHPKTRKTTRKTVSSPDRIEAYALDVVAGRIVAGPHVRNACQRHLDDLAKGSERGLRYDRADAAEAIAFFEELLKLSEGQFEGQPFKLHASQAFIVGSLFGWKAWNEEAGEYLRRFRNAYVEQGKGNGKSPLAAGIGLKGLCADGEPGAQIFSAAAKRDQAAILFADAVKMVKAAPALAKRLRLSGGDQRETNIAHVQSGSFFRPVSRDTGKTGSGHRPHFALVDEIHELPDRTIITALERGFKFRRQPLTLKTTNSGSDRNSVCWEEHEHAIKVAAGNHDAVTDPTYLGEVIDDATFSYVCALDRDDDPLNDPRCWEKANPLLGVTLTRSYLAGVVAEAKAIPGKLNSILRLHFCVWTDADRAWMTREALEPCLADFDPTVHDGKRIGVGIDLSQNKDITAKAAIVETGAIELTVEINGQQQIVSKPTYDAWIEAWTPGDTLDARALKDKAPYSVWVAQGHLHAPPGKTIRYDHVAQGLAEDSFRYEVGLVAYDRYAFKKFEEECEKLGLAVDFIEHPQAGSRKGKPSAAMKEAAKDEGREAEGLWMPASLRALEDAILEGRIRIKSSPLVISAMMSAVTDKDRWGNHWLAKERALNKIDAAVALCMAMGAAMAMGTERRDAVNDFIAQMKAAA